MKIALVGAGGQLAFDIARELAGHEVVGLTRTELDIRDASLVHQVMDTIKPQLVINTAAYNLVDKAETDQADAYANNAIGPTNLAKECGRLDLPLIHVSTDYVYGLDADRKTPWEETDAPGPVSVYGNSKLAGENLVRAYCPRHFVLRTCGLYGVKGSRGKGGNFVETMLRLGGQGGPVRVVADQHCTPSATADIARAVAGFVGLIDEPKAYGLYHVTNTGGTTWHQFATEIFRQAGLKVACEPITTAQFNAPARRPPYSVLSTKKMVAAGVPALPSWEEAIGHYLKARANRPSA